jgi:hypothetical protein
MPEKLDKNFNKNAMPKQGATMGRLLFVGR